MDSDVVEIAREIYISMVCQPLFHSPPTECERRKKLESIANYAMAAASIFEQTVEGYEDYEDESDDC